MGPPRDERTPGGFEMKQMQPVASAFDLFPELSDEVDRRIAYAETRVKNWVLVGILGNVLTLGAAVTPAVYFLGQLSTSAAEAVSTIERQQSELERLGAWRSRRMIWESNLESWAVQKGFRPPRQEERE